MPDIDPLPCPRCGKTRRYGTGGTLCSRCRYTLRRRQRGQREKATEEPQRPLLFSRREYDRLGNAGRVKES